MWRSEAVNLILEQNRARHYMAWAGPWKPVEELTVTRRTATHVSVQPYTVYESQATAAVPERVAYPLQGITIAE